MESQKKQPFFSIVMPAYKVEKYIGKAIKYSAADIPGLGIDCSGRLFS